MTGDVAALVTGVLGIMALIKGSCVPILFLLAWYLLLYFMMYRHYVSCNGKANIFFWTIAMFQAGEIQILENGKFHQASGFFSCFQRAVFWNISYKIRLSEQRKENMALL